jgi:hypothetical protein
VVERGGLENRYTFTGIEGSNPSLSATWTAATEIRGRNSTESFASRFQSIFISTENREQKQKVFQEHTSDDCTAFFCLRRDGRVA